ncbi:MAG: hypothetical protein QMC37_04970 [Flavobacteriales bacterium]
MDWFNIDIDEQGIEYQVAFLFAELLALMFGCHDDCFAYARNKEMWYEGPYDKHMIKLSKLTQQLKIMTTADFFEREYARNNKVVRDRV